VASILALKAAKIALIAVIIALATVITSILIKTYNEEADAAKRVNEALE
jgi:hypothetical protein